MKRWEKVVWKHGLDGNDMSKALDFKCIKMTVVELVKDRIRRRVWVHVTVSLDNKPQKNRPVSKWCHLHHGLGHQKPESNMESTSVPVCHTGKIS